MTKIKKGDNLWEVLKEISQGVETHDHWEDDEGNVIIPKSPVSKDGKLKELWDAYQSELYTTVEYNGKVYGNSKDDQDSVSDAIWAIGEGLFPESGIPWHTYLGEETITFTAQDVKALKFASVQKKQVLFAKYSGLEAQVKATTTDEELEAIHW